MFSLESDEQHAVCQTKYMVDRAAEGGSGPTNGGFSVMEGREWKSRSRDLQGLPHNDASFVSRNLRVPVSLQTKHVHECPLPQNPQNQKEMPSEAKP